MTMISAMANAGCEWKVDALRAEFGAVLTARILECEATEFLWESRVKERYLGQHFDVWFGEEQGEVELTRVAILSFLGGRWHAALCLVDGDGMAVDLLWKRSFESQETAEARFEAAL